VPEGTLPESKGGFFDCVTYWSDREWTYKSLNLRLFRRTIPQDPKKIPKCNMWEIIHEFWWKKYNETPDGDFEYEDSHTHSKEGKLGKYVVVYSIYKRKLAV
jgi:hypothetical protein